MLEKMEIPACRIHPKDFQHHVNLDSCCREINASKPQSDHNGDTLLESPGTTVGVVHCTQESSCQDRWDLRPRLCISSNQGTNQGYKRPLRESTLL